MVRTERRLGALRNLQEVSKGRLRGTQHAL
jgi:hypothetical protein